MNPPPATSRTPRPFPDDKAIVHERLRELYRSLKEHYGDVGGWWPGESKFEIILGAILTQQTTWQSVERALAGLKNNAVLTTDDTRSVTRVLETDPEELAWLIRSTGFYNQKTERVLIMAAFLKEASGGDLDRLAREETVTLRRSLLDLKGIGNETADSILLYALDRPVFVVDAYSFRLLERLGIYRDEKRNYLTLQELFEGSIRQDIRIYKQYHGLIVNFSKEFCKKTPLCDPCFLKGSCWYHSGSRITMENPDQNLDKNEQIY